MKVAILGAGFTGLSAAYRLSKLGHTVTVFEKDSSPGGLAIGYKENEWEWSLEKHYHHWFTNDNSVLALASEIGYEVLIKRPKTSVYVEDTIFQLDSPIKLLTFPKLSLVNRLRMATVLAILRYNPFWQPLEKISAGQFLSKTMGKKNYQMIWEPQLRNKFGEYLDEISLAWFWARIKKRTPSLAYPKGGFLSFANHLTDVVKKNADVYFDTEVLEIVENKGIDLTIQNKEKKKKMHFDTVVVTLPSFFFLKIAPQLPDTYKQQLLKLKGLGAINIVLRLKEPFFKDNTYWLSVCDTSSKVMAIVEHTNFMDKKYYNNEHIVYLGNYLPFKHPYFSKTKKELLAIYDPFLKKINKEYDKAIIDFEMFQAPFAQPIIPINYSKILPPFTTPLKNVFLANIQQVYPWDRGTNYAVELGEKIARLITMD